MSLGQTKPKWSPHLAFEHFEECKHESMCSGNGELGGKICYLNRGQQYRHPKLAYLNSNYPQEQKIKDERISIVVMVGRTAVTTAGEDDEDDGAAVPLGELGFPEEELVQLAKISASIASQNWQALKSMVLMFTVPFPTFRPIEV